jgi:prepilin-type N-terminal cleavage/methylation domain-containing protein
MKKSAFTLLELIVSLSLVTLFLLVLVTVSNLLLQKCSHLKAQQQEGSNASLLFHRKGDCKN